MNTIAALWVLLAALASALPTFAADMPDIDVDIFGPSTCATGGITGECKYTVRLANKGNVVYWGPVHFIVDMRNTVRVPLDDPPVFARLGRHSVFPYRCLPSGVCFLVESGPKMRCKPLPFLGEAVICRYDQPDLRVKGAEQFEFFYRLPPGLEDAPEIEELGGLTICANAFWPMRSAQAYPNHLVATMLALLAYAESISDFLEAPNFETFRQAIKDFRIEYDLPVTGSADLEIDDRLMRTLFPGAAQMLADGDPSNDQSCVTTPIHASD